MATTQTTEDKKPAAKSASKPASKARPKAASNTGAASTLKAKAAAKPASVKAKATPSKPSAKPANRQSRDTSMTSKERDEHVERIWELAKRIGIAMFVTWDGNQQRARPLAATIEKAEGAIYFLTDIHGHADQQVVEFPKVSISFADHKHAKYVAMAGKATISNDRERIKEIWSPFAKAWWDSPDDPAIRIIRFVPQDAELWDSPGRIVTTISMLASAVTGRQHPIGENAKVVL